jgi:hypothetical protein
MAKKGMLERELKRKKLVLKYSEKLFDVNFNEHLF